jgi:hypothetical protein
MVVLLLTEMDPGHPGMTRQASCLGAYEIRRACHIHKGAPFIDGKAPP